MGAVRLLGGAMYRAATLFAFLLLGLVELFSAASAATTTSPNAGCGAVPTVLQNPPEMARVNGPTQLLDLESARAGSARCRARTTERAWSAPTQLQKHFGE